MNENGVQCDKCFNPVRFIIVLFNIDHVNEQVTRFAKILLLDENLDAKSLGIDIDISLSMVEKLNNFLFDIRLLAWPPGKHMGRVNYFAQNMFLAPAVTVGETEGAMDSTSVFFLPLLLPITL